MVYCGTVHDPEGLLVELAQKGLSRITPLFSGVVTAVTKQTDQRLWRVLGENSMNPEEGGSYARGRLNALRDALVIAKEFDGENIISIDFDKLLHWDMVEPIELEKISAYKTEGLLLLGRTQKAWKTYPRSWRNTERIINVVANKVFKKKDWDWFTGTAIFSQAAARAIIDISEEDSVGVKYPVFGTACPRLGIAV